MHAGLEYVIKPHPILLKMPKSLPEKGVAGLPTDEYYLDDHGRVVFTALHHHRRGYCCKSGCRHCPYGFQADQRRTSGFDEFKSH